MRHLWRDDKRRLGGLDLLRSAAIVSVVLCHYSAFKPFPLPFNLYGWIGVDLFFVLSGYLIGGQLFSLQSKHHSIPLKTFYMRRFMRTLPNYYAVLALYLLIPALSPSTFKAKLAALWQYVIFTQNLTLQLPFFHISWSLCVEEHFYLLLPLMVCLFMKRKRKVILWVFPLVILGELILRAAILFYGQQNLRLENHADALSYMTNIYYPTYCRLDGLTIGVALAAMSRYQPLLWSRLMARGNQLLLAGIIGLFLSFILMWSNLYIFAGTLNFTVLGISFGLLTASALSPNCILSRVRSRAITLLAELAYSIYLTHHIAFYLTGAVLSKSVLGGHNRLYFIFTMLAVLTTALALFALVERPCLRLRDRMFVYKNPEAANAAAGAEFCKTRRA
jgi:peptidoglycan/LPS O-acetylase OafA/YrhL